MKQKELSLFLDDDDGAQSCLTFTTPWIITCPAPLPMEFSKQEYQSGLPFFSPGDLPNPGIEQGLLLWQEDSLPLSPWGSP